MSEKQVNKPAEKQVDNKIDNMEKREKLYFGTIMIRNLKI